MKSNKLASSLKAFQNEIRVGVIWISGGTLFQRTTLLHKRCAFKTHKDDNIQWGDRTYSSPIVPNHTGQTEIIKEALQIGGPIFPQEKKPESSLTCKLLDSLLTHFACGKPANGGHITMGCCKYELAVKCLDHTRVIMGFCNSWNFENQL